MIDLISQRALSFRNLFTEDLINRAISSIRPHAAEALEFFIQPVNREHGVELEIAIIGNTFLHDITASEKQILIHSCKIADINCTTIKEEGEKFRLEITATQVQFYYETFSHSKADELKKFHKATVELWGRK